MLLLSNWPAFRRIIALLSSIVILISLRTDLEDLSALKLHGCNMKASRAWSEINGAPFPIPHKSYISYKRISKKAFGNIHLRKQRLIDDLSRIQIRLGSQPSYRLLLQEHALKDELRRSRELWLTFGDGNTSFFHASTIIRRNRNRIVGLGDSNVAWLEGNEVLESHAISFFGELYRNDGSASGVLDLEGFPDLPVELLGNLIQRVEVKRSMGVIKAMKGLKSPGLDGY
ncbi:hypothetical protein V2J09_020424 [Rumex salicifolius]